MNDKPNQIVNILLIGGVWHFSPYTGPENVKWHGINVPKERFERGDKLVEFCNKHHLSVNNKDCLLTKHSIKLKY